ncbi:MAG: phage tail tape measure C-terminal domain-containing protein [Pseudomonadota bacterium]
MDEFEQSIEGAGERLRALADGPANEAAASIEQRFSEAGQRIEAALSSAARTGQLDFEKMTEAILRDLARVAAQSALGANNGASPTVNLNLSGGANANARGIVAGQGAISSALARAVSAGGRFL